LSSTASPRATAEARQRAVSAFGQRRRITTSDMATFNRQMADLLTAGVALVKALSILTKQTTNEVMREVVADVNSEVQGGATFADALARHPREFSNLYVAMVRSGEAGGMLPEVLERLADFSESEEQLRGRIKSALAYPVVMVVAGSGAVFVMFSYVVPKIVSTFEELDQTLPAMTQLLISMSTFTEQYWLFILVGLALSVAGLWQFLRTPDGRALWHRHQLRLPVLGDLVRKREVARFARTLGSLLKNGVPILTALNITREVANNTLVKSEIDKVKDEITQGAGLAQPLKQSLIFPAVTVNMMAVGEETGQLERVLLRISDSYEVEVDRKIKTLTALLEPLIICVMGLVVGFIVISMLLPIFFLDPTGGGG
jgi:type II secretion system protein F